MSGREQFGHYEINISINPVQCESQIPNHSVVAHGGEFTVDLSVTTFINGSRKYSVDGRIVVHRDNPVIN
jgi:hypothetical protein